MSKREQDNVLGDQLLERIARTAHVAKTQRWPPADSYVLSARENSHKVPFDIGREFCPAWAKRSKALDPAGWMEPFAPVGDLHLGTKLCNEAGIKRYFSIAVSKGVTKFLHAGDIHDGLFIYPEQPLHLKVVGVEEQVEYAAAFLNKVMPKGSHMYAVNGNHELGGRKGVYNTYGADMMDMLGKELPEKLTYLRNRLGGNMFARIVATPKITMDLVHAQKYVGRRAAPEYTLMNMIDGYPVKAQPTFLFVNHTHRAVHSNYRDVHSFLCGAFEFPNNFTARNGEGGKHGSFILQPHVDQKGNVDYLEQSFVEVRRGL